MTVDDRDQHTPDEEEPQADEPQPTGPAPEDPRSEGPQAPADDAPTEPLGGPAGAPGAATAPPVGSAWCVRARAV